jgi:hypothetical protein
MHLSFYQLPMKYAEILLAQNVNVYFYNNSIKERQIVGKDSLANQLELSLTPSNGYFQILIKDINFIQDSDVIIEIAEYNKELLLYVDRFNLRREKYQAFYRPEWKHLPELGNAFKVNDFLPLANLIQAELSIDSQDISVFASTVSDCLEKILRRDSNLCRMLCFSYCFFKQMDFSDRSLLYDFLGAVILKDLGLSQNQSKNIFEQNEIYHKHPYYSLFLLKKLPVELTQKCYFFILDHHESQDGSGFPKQKIGTHYHPLCDVLKTSERLFLMNSNLAGYKSEMLKLRELGDVLNSGVLDCLRLTCSYLTY